MSGGTSRLKSIVAFLLRLGLTDDNQLFAAFLVRRFSSFVSSARWKTLRYPSLRTADEFGLLALFESFFTQINDLLETKLLSFDVL
ncbi:MAG: hypothetical protein M3Q78_00645 [Acidobacteriota bacterium]|jgi:hypothetical protein|nr:hypothetical protein [Acidobacteriota bacterium]